MKTLFTVEIEPVFVEFVPEVLEERKVYVSKEYSVAVHNCLCGCGEKTVTPLNTGGWVLTEDKGRISLTPSIGNYQLPCKSHYILTNNKANFV